MPLRKMVGVIEKIEYDSLESLLPLDGHPSDELTHLSLKFNDMLTRLNDMAERQKAFTANASRELKTPLSRAISSLDLLYQDSAHNKDEIRLIRDDLFEINNLIERLLLLTRLKKDIHMEKSRSVSLLNFFVDLKARLEPQLIKKQLTLVIDSPEKAPLLIPKEYLSIIFSNIVLNAIKYSPPNRHIYITAAHAGSEMVISVKDEGIGMDKNDLERMFDRFFRGKGTRENGYGIGLSLVKQICDLYNITIYPVSEKNIGTTISLHFPS
jgi:two-component system OmpR family sensor kinase